MSGQHTPGPWAAFTDRQFDSQVNTNVVAVVPFTKRVFGFVGMDKSNPDILLICQAPEMARLIRERLRQVEAGEVQRTALDDNFAAVLDKAGVE